MMRWPTLLIFLPLTAAAEINFSNAVYDIRLDPRVVWTGPIWTTRGDHTLQPQDFYELFAGLRERCRATETAAGSNVVQITTGKTVQITGNDSLPFFGLGPGSNGVFSITNFYKVIEEFDDIQTTTVRLGRAYNVFPPVLFSTFVSRRDPTNEFFWGPFDTITATNLADSSYTGTYHYVHRTNGQYRSLLLSPHHTTPFAEVGIPVRIDLYTNTGGRALADFGPRGMVYSSRATDTGSGGPGGIESRNRADLLPSYGFFATPTEIFGDDFLGNGWDGAEFSFQQDRTPRFQTVQFVSELGYDTGSPAPRGGLVTGSLLTNGVPLRFSFVYDYQDVADTLTRSFNVPVRNSPMGYELPAMTMIMDTFTRPFRAATNPAPFGARFAGVFIARNRLIDGVDSRYVNQTRTNSSGDFSGFVVVPPLWIGTNFWQVFDLHENFSGTQFRIQTSNSIVNPYAMEIATNFIATNFLNDIYRAINGLQWTEKPATFTADGQLNERKWQGVSTQSFTAARSIAETNLIFVATNDLPPFSYTAGEVSSNTVSDVITWTATAATRRSKLFATNLWTEAPHIGTFYARGQLFPPPVPLPVTNVFDANSVPVLDGIHTQFHATASTTNLADLTPYHGTSNFPAWTIDPILADGVSVTNSVRGFTIDAEAAVIQWEFRFAVDPL